ncbi:MAG TPA: endonuclease/exonuclease/phosphatase family protein [Actinoplanes sp.]|nr:endonuclease/exonuclease/phosphatase family protein [Actinoplanes sp.]
MRATTWNLWWRFGGAWREREPEIADVLKQLEPDIVGLVETWSGDGITQPGLLADQLGSRHSVFVPTSLPPAPDPPEEPSQADIEIGLGLISRWPILNTEVHNLPNQQRAGPPPTALLATLDHPRGPLHVIVACLEWKPEYAVDQLAQSKALAALAADPRLDGDLPVLLLGDLNADVTQPELAPLLAVLIDSWSLAGGDPAAVTLSSALLEAPLEATKQIDRRIDHILARSGRPAGKLTAQRAFLAGTQATNSRHPSNHFAVVVDIDV